MVLAERFDKMVDDLVSLVSHLVEALTGENLRGYRLQEARVTVPRDPRLALLFNRGSRRSLPKGGCGRY